MRALLLVLAAAAVAAPALAPAATALAPLSSLYGEPSVQCTGLPCERMILLCKMAQLFFGNVEASIPVLGCVFE